MTSETQLASLKQAVPTWKVVADRLPDLKKQGSEYKARCPFHSDKTASFTVYLSEGVWLYKCFGCAASGNCIQFVAAFDRISFPEAVKKLQNLTEWGEGSSQVEQTFRPIQENKKATVTFNTAQLTPAEEALERTASANQWLAERGIHLDTARKFRIGYVQSVEKVNPYHPWVADGWLLFPTFDGQDVTFLKYRSVRGKKGDDGTSGIISKSGMKQSLYNARAIEPFSDVHIVEGEPDCLIMSQAGYQTVGLPGASYTISPTERDQLLQANTIYLAGDMDAAGQDAMGKLWVELKDRTYLIKWPEPYKDANEVFLQHCQGSVPRFQELMEELKIKARESPMPFVYDLKENLKTAHYTKPVDNPNRLFFPWPNVDSMVAVLPGDVMFLFGNESKVGKALAADTLIPIPCGAMVPIKSLRPGDHVFGKNGKPVQVYGVFPQGERTVWRMTFSDGTTIDCDKDHLWEVHNCSWYWRNKNGLESPAKVMTTEQITKEPLVMQNRLRNYIPACAPIEFEKKHLPLHPYVLGVLLGDGNLTNTSCNFTSDDPEIVNHVAKFVPSECEVMGTKHKITFRITRKKGENRKRYNPVITALRQLGVFGHRAETKFIPDIYKFSSVEDRIELLRGLCDTDGYAGDRGTVEFSSSSKRLADDVLFLVQSLGGKASMKVKETKCLPSNRMYLSMPVGINPFYLSRKAKKFQRTKDPRRGIVKIEQLPEKKEMLCIKVNAPDGLFVAENFIVTHNSSWLLNILLENAIKKNKIIVNYCAEFTPEDYAVMAASYLTRQNREQLTSEHFSKASGLMGEAQFFLGYKPGSMWSEVIDLLKWAKRRLGADILVVDPLSFLVRGDKVWQEQGEAMRALKDLALEFKVIVIVVGQPRKISGGQKTRDAGSQDASGSYTQATDASQVFILHRDRLPVQDGDQTVFDPVTRVKLDYSRRSESRVTKLFFDGAICRFFPHDGRESAQ